MNKYEAALDAASDAVSVARKAMDRSKSKVNKLAFQAAWDAYEPILEAFSVERDRLIHAETVAWRLAVTAPRREMRARQYVMAF